MINPVERIRPFLKKQYDNLTGDKDRLADMFTVMYGGRADEKTELYRNNLKKAYIFILIITVICISVSVIYTLLGGRGISEITRPEPGEESLYIPVEISAEYSGTETKSRMELSIGNRSMTDDEIEAALDECEEYLNSVFTKNEEGKRTVSSDLTLPEGYKNTGIIIKWSSSDPVLISDDGKTDVIALAGESETVTLSAVMSYSGHVRNADFDVLVYDDSSMYSQSMKSRISSFVSEINDDRYEEIIKLPSELGDGINLKWTEKKRSWTGVTLVISAAAFFIVYSGRYSRAKKKVKQYRENVISAFPAVIDKLILLLNSGLTVFSALMRISQDYEKAEHSFDSELGREAAEIGRHVRNTNANILEEWKSLAAKMESSDMLRFCTILADNINTGSNLAEKLEAESENLREMRRKELRKKIHMVDSRMMVPMMIMLFSLILITVAPAMLSFN